MLIRIVSALFGLFLTYGWKHVPVQKKLALGGMTCAKVYWRLRPTEGAAAHGEWQVYLDMFSPLPTLYHDFLVTFDNQARAIARQHPERPIEFALALSGEPDQHVPVAFADVEFIFSRGKSPNGKKPSPNGIVQAMQGVILPRGGI